MSILFCRRRKNMAMFKCAYLFAFFFLLAFLAEAGENIITIPSCHAPPKSSISYRGKLLNTPGIP